MKYLFIDFDGVLHPQDASKHDFSWESHLADALWPARPLVDLSIVVHSTWREAYLDRQLQQQIKALRPWFRGSVVSGPRWRAIQLYVAAKRIAADDFLVLDDMIEEFPDPPPRQLVLCDPSSGVSDPEVLARVRKWLGNGKLELERT